MQNIFLLLSFVVSVSLFALDLEPSSEKDCKTFRDKAMAKISESNKCAQDSDCVLFKSDFTCKGQGINKKTNQKELRALEKQYKACYKKLNSNIDMVCTTDYAMTDKLCDKGKCAANVDGFGPRDDKKSY